ncbi:unnamed protein product [Rodentolepis nana]|uniref:Myb/SANT-like DNA-binding domain-containing protein n=1 Tax=Rodentolepis nana TaxID=102285 RepID=A0A0R3TL28_RODNA|nr:unnamed protein product [Rodentolepis nana]
MNTESELDTESGGSALSLELDTESGGSSPFPPLDTESGGSSPFPPLNTESGGSSPFSPVENQMGLLHFLLSVDPDTYLHYNGTRTTPDLPMASSDISEHAHLKIIDDPGSGHKPVIELIYSSVDPDTYLHYNGTRTTPDLPMASSDISEHAHLKIIDDPGSGHKPVIGSITIGKNELHTSPLNFNQHPDKLCTDIMNIMIRCAKKTISRGKTYHYRVFWSEYLEELKCELKRNRTEELKRKWDALRNTADQTGRTEDVQAWRRQSAVLRQAILKAKQQFQNISLGKCLVLFGLRISRSQISDRTIF